MRLEQLKLTIYDRQCLGQIINDLKSPVGLANFLIGRHSS